MHLNTFDTTTRAGEVWQEEWPGTGKKYLNQSSEKKQEICNNIYRQILLRNQQNQSQDLAEKDV